MWVSLLNQEILRLPLEDRKNPSPLSTFLIPASGSILLLHIRLNANKRKTPLSYQKKVGFQILLAIPSLRTRELETLFLVG